MKVYLLVAYWLCYEQDLDVQKARCQDTDADAVVASVLGVSGAMEQKTGLRIAVG